MPTQISGSVPAFACRRTTLGLVLILAGAAAGTLPTVLTAAEVLRTTITVRVYQTAGLPSPVEHGALAEADTVLRAALVDVGWRRCTGKDPSPACNVPPGASEFSLRIVRDGAPRRDASVTLGNAVVDRHAAGGRLATVYYHHVASLAKATGTDAGVLLGRAVAHELGHLLMQTSAHPRRGLMRPSWTAGEVRRNSAADWAFTAGDVAAIRRPRSSY